MFVVGGESLIDLKEKPVKDGVMPLTAHAGGSPMNCAIALKKLGHDTGFLCPISQDKFGGMILEPLAAAGVKVLLKKRVQEPTTLAVVSDDGKGNPRYQFYRHADRAFTREGLLKALPDRVELYQIGGFSPIRADDAAIWMDVVDEAAARGATISIDINVRDKLIDDEAGYRNRLSAFLDKAHLVKLSEEDHDWLKPGMSIEAHAAELLARPKCELVVVTLGEEGSKAFSSTGTAVAPIHKPPVFGDTVGAGDSLMAGILTWLGEAGALKPGGLAGLDASQLKTMLRFGAVVAGINCGRKGCQPPSRAEVDAVLGA